MAVSTFLQNQKKFRLYCFFYLPSHSEFYSQGILTEHGPRRRTRWNL